MLATVDWWCPQRFVRHRAGLFADPRVRAGFLLPFPNSEALFSTLYLLSPRDSSLRLFFFSFFFYVCLP